MEAIFHILRRRFKVGKEIFIFQTESSASGVEKFGYIVKRSSLPILVVTALDAKDAQELKKLSEIMPSPQGYLVLNFDDNMAKEVNKGTTLTYGFQKGADFQATDVKTNGGTNFKINYKGNIVPVWLAQGAGKEQIYSSLAAAAVAAILGLNLVEISQALKKI